MAFDKLFLLLSCLLISHSAAFLSTPSVFSARNGLRREHVRPAFKFALKLRDRSGSPVECRAAVPSWEEIGGMMPTTEPAPSPVLTLYRDTNAWCPFCERVWLALLEKGIPFDEKLVSLYNKPDWYKEMVPTGLVPAIKIHANEEVLWESNEILKRIEQDDFFAEYPTLCPPSEAEKAEKMMAEIQTNMANVVRTVYGQMNTTDDLAAAAKDLEKDVDGMDEVLGASKSPFFLDSGFSVVDCAYVPILERLAVQLPSKVPIQLRGNPRWPNLNAWFDALEEQVPSYRNRVQGDVYSWTVTISALPGQGNMSLVHKDRIEATRAEAQAVLRSQMQAPPSDAALADRREAVRVLLGNREAVVQDAVSEAKSQGDLERVESAHAEEVDRALRRAAAVLLEQDAGAALHGATPVEGKAAELIAARLCVPRDMGAPQAAALRSGLGQVAAAAAAEALAEAK